MKRSNFKSQLAAMYYLSKVKPKRYKLHIYKHGYELRGIDNNKFFIHTLKFDKDKK